MKKKALVILLSVLSIFNLMANGQQEDSNSLELEFAIASTEEGIINNLQSIVDELIGEFNEKNGTNHTVWVNGNQKKELLNTRMSSLDKPDIMELDGPADVYQYAIDGLLLDITDMIDKAHWEKEMFSWAYDLSKVNNKIVTLPFGYEGMVLWYNKDIMKELGINPDDLTDLASFENALEKAKQANYIPIMLGSQDWPWAQEWYSSILFSYSDRELLKNVIKNKDGANWNNPKFQETIALYKSWHEKMYLSAGQSFNLTSDDAINAFTNDKALFKLEGTWGSYWIIPLDEESQNKIGVMLHPPINNREAAHFPLAVGCMLCGSADSAAPEAIAYILDGLMREKYQKSFLDLGADIAPIELEPATFDHPVPAIKDMWGIVNQALASGDYGYATWAFYPPQVRLFMYESIVSVLENQMSIEDYLSRMDKIQEDDVANGFIPVIP